jgi:aldehyde dehydrogenase (NAD+)
LKKVTLELGGKSPTIIFPDANLEKAIPKIAFGFVLNSGQACISTNRVYVHDDIVDEFTDKLKKRIESTYSPNMGDPLTSSGLRHGNSVNVGLGPLADNIQHANVMKFIEEGKKSGAKVVTGGKRHGSKGYFIQPTVFGDVFPSIEELRLGCRRFLYHEK